MSEGPKEFDIMTVGEFRDAMRAALPEDAILVRRHIGTLNVTESAPATSSWCIPA